MQVPIERFGKGTFVADSGSAKMWALARRSSQFVEEGGGWTAHFSGCGKLIAFLLFAQEQPLLGSERDHAIDCGAVVCHGILPG